MTIAERNEARARLLFLCDHASNAVPAELDLLGLSEADFARHIAYDIGAAELTRRLADLWDAPALLARWSRLVVDLNRGGDDPTVVMKLSDGRIIPGNRDLGREGIEDRIRRFHAPYHAAIAALIRDAAAERHRAGPRVGPQLHAAVARREAALAHGCPVGS